MVHNVLSEGLEFLGSRKLTPEDEIGNFKEWTFVGKDFDRISSVLENTFVTIDERYGGGAGNSVHVSWIIASENFSFVGELG